MSKNHEKTTIAHEEEKQPVGLIENIVNLLPLEREHLLGHNRLHIERLAHHGTSDDGRGVHCVKIVEVDIEEEQDLHLREPSPQPEEIHGQGLQGQDHHGDIQGPLFAPDLHQLAEMSLPTTAAQDHP